MPKNGSSESGKMNFSLPQFLPETQCAASRGLLARISPLPKVCFAVVFLVLAVSFRRYDWHGSTLFACAPFLMARLGGVSVAGLLCRALLTLPFVLCTATANLFFDWEGVEVAGGIVLPGGVISFWVLTTKTLATTGMVLLLTATTTLTDISGTLAQLHVPCILILQIQLLCRYLVLTAKEARNLSHGYFLRNPQCRIIPAHDWGMLCGRLFLRSVERAGAIYQAMQCRLFHAGKPIEKSGLGSFSEWCVCLPALFFFSILRGVFV